MPLGRAGSTPVLGTFNSSIESENIMDEIKKQLSEKLGLSEDISQQAVDMVLGFVKDKLPESMQGVVESAMNGEMPDTDGLLDKAKGLFGG